MQHIKPGEPIRASMLNQLIDHADGVTEEQIGGIPNFRVSSTTIRVQADADLPRYAVVGIDDILFDPAVNKEAFSKEPAVKAGQPNAATKNFAILQQPATSEQIVPACVSGVSIVELVIGNSQHEFAVPNEDYTMTTAESGVARILWKQASPGDDGKTWGLVSFPVGGSGSAPAVQEDLYCTLITPVGNGFDVPLAFADDVNTEKGFNATRAGLGSLNNKTSNNPLPVYEVASGKLAAKQNTYYKKLTIKLHEGSTTPEYDSFGNIKFNEYIGNKHAALYGFLASLKAGEDDEEIKYDYSDVWETTDDPAEAIPNNYVIVSPHTYSGFYPYKKEYKTALTGTADVSNGKTWQAVRLIYTYDQHVNLKGQIDYPLYAAAVVDGEITWNQITTHDEFLSHQGKIMIIRPQYNGDRLSVIDNNFIENRCDNTIPSCMGLAIDDNNIPQLISCDTIPFACCVPVLKVNCLYRITQQTASPSYNVNQYPVLLGDNKLVLGTVNYLPGNSPNCS